MIYIPIFVNIVLLLLFDYRCLSFSLSCTAILSGTITLGKGLSFPLCAYVLHMHKVKTIDIKNLSTIVIYLKFYTPS